MYEPIILKNLTTVAKLLSLLNAANESCVRNSGKSSWR